MTVSSMMNSFSVVKAAGLCILGLSLTLGGCNKQLKEDNAALQSQNAALIAENNEMKVARDATATRMAQLEQAAGAKGDVSYGGPGDGGGGGGERRARNQSGGTVFVVAGDVLFDSGQATLKSGAKKELDGIAGKIRNQHSGQSIRVEGYTDSDPLVKTKAKWGSNEGLSEARAEAVRKYLVGKGVSSGSISAVGMGAAKPKSSKKDSRRVEIVVLAD